MVIMSLDLAGSVGWRPPGTSTAPSGGVGEWSRGVSAGTSAGLLFDLDGTLIDSVYQHVIAWRAALSDIGIDLSVWRIHRRIGMSGGLFVQALLRETGRTLSAEDIVQLQQAHAVEYSKQMGSVTALPGARELLAALTGAGVQWAIATSGYAATARPALELLGLPEDTPMVTRDLVRHAKPDPDLFLAAAALLGVEPRNAMVVGDSVWDLLAARRALARHRAAVRRVRARGTRARGRLPGVRRPGRDALPTRRDRRPPRRARHRPAPGRRCCRNCELSRLRAIAMTVGRRLSECLSSAAGDHPEVPAFGGRDVPWSAGRAATAARHRFAAGPPQ